MRDVIKDMPALKAFTSFSRRNPHPGLYFDQVCFGIRENDAQAKRRLVDETAKLATPPGYADFVRRWRAGLDAAGDTQVASAQTHSNGGRVIVGLGGKGIIEAGITLHHTWGVPYLPGSALKGLARAFAAQRLDPSTWGPESKAYQILFGDTEDAGFVTFHDALPMADSKMASPKLHPDVMTVHHPDYYQQGKGVAADWDDPTPIPFLSASGTFLIALSGPAAWRDVAFQILGLALQEMGIGAKTSSGYGRLSLNYAEAGVSEPSWTPKLKEEAPRKPGSEPRDKAQNRHSSAPSQAPVATPKPPGNADALLRDFQAFDLRDKRGRAIPEVRKFFVGRFKPFQELPESEQLRAAKDILAELASSRKPNEFDSLDMVKAMRAMVKAMRHA